MPLKWTRLYFVYAKKKNKQDESKNLNSSQYTTICDKIPWAAFFLAVLKNEIKNIPHLEIQYPYPIPFPAFNTARAQTTDSFFRGRVGQTKTIHKCCDLHGTVWAIVSQIVGESFVQTLFSKRYLKEKTFTILHTNDNTISIFVILRKIDRIYLLVISAIFQRWGWKKNHDPFCFCLEMSFYMIIFLTTALKKYRKFGS